MEEKYVMLGIAFAIILIRTLICIAVIRLKGRTYNLVGKAYEKKLNNRLILKNNIIVYLTKEDVEAALSIIPQAKERIVSFSDK